MSANCKIEIPGQSGRTAQIDYYPYSGGGPIDLGTHLLPYCFDCSFCGRFVITFVDTGEICEVIQVCTTPTPTPSPTLRFSPTPTPSGTGPTPTPSGTGPTPTPSGTGPTPTPSPTGPTPTPTDTSRPTPTPSGTGPTPTPFVTGPVPTPTCVPFEITELYCVDCVVSVLPPFRSLTTFNIGIITATTEYFGPPLIYESNPSYINEDQLSCSGLIIPANSIILGYNPGNFTYTITFSDPVNEIKFVTSSGGTNNPITSIDTDYEVFIFNTNTGQPNLEICGDSCGVYVQDNEYYLTYPSTIVNNGVGGGSLVKVTSNLPYTAITISGTGGLGGTLFGICSNFEKCSYGMDVAFLIDYTGSMWDAIDEIKNGVNNIINEIETLSNSNYRLNLIIFDEYDKTNICGDNPCARPNYDTSPIWNTLPPSKIYRVDSTTFQGNEGEVILTSFVDFSLNNKDEFITYLNYLNRVPPLGIPLGNGIGGPEPSDIAIDRKINQNFGGQFRLDAYKLIIVITDNLPGGLEDDYTINVQNRLDLLISQCISRGIDVLLVRETFRNDKLLELSLRTSGTWSDSNSGANITNLISSFCYGVECLENCKTFSGLPTNNQTIVYQNFIITGFSTGDVSSYITDNRQLCLGNFVFPNLQNNINTVSVFNNSEPFTYTIRFDRPVNDIMLYIISLGESSTELVLRYQKISFMVDGNTNNVKLYKDPKSCNTLIDNNSVLGRADCVSPGLELCSSNSLILVNYVTNYTEITLYSDDTLSFGGVIIGICDYLCGPPTQPFSGLCLEYRLSSLCNNCVPQVIPYLTNVVNFNPSSVMQTRTGTTTYNGIPVNIRYFGVLPNQGSNGTPYSNDCILDPFLPTNPDNANYSLSLGKQYFSNLGSPITEYIILTFEQPVNDVKIYMREGGVCYSGDPLAGPYNNQFEIYSFTTEYGVPTNVKYCDGCNSFVETNRVHLQFDYESDFCKQVINSCTTNGYDNTPRNDINICAGTSIVQISNSIPYTQLKINFESVTNPNIYLDALAGVSVYFCIDSVSTPTSIINQLNFQPNGYINGYPSWIATDISSNIYQIYWSLNGYWVLNGWTHGGEPRNNTLPPNFPLIGWYISGAPNDVDFYVYTGNCVTPTPIPTPSPTGPTPTPSGTGPTPTPSPSPTILPQPLFDRSSFIGVVSEPYLTLLNQSCDRWETYIKFNPSIYTTIQSLRPTWNGIKLHNYTLVNEPLNGAIAGCGVWEHVDIYGLNTDIKFNTFSFILYINDFYRTVYNTQDWINILTHELGHALGIGIFWRNTFPGAVPPVSNFLNGLAYTNAQSAYNSIVSQSRTQIPLESTGGSGTQSAHWEDNYRNSSAPGSGGLDHRGVVNELMVGYYYSGLNSKLSRLSIKICVDFGYEEVNIGTSEGDPNVSVSLVAGNNVMTMNNMIKLNCVCEDHLSESKKVGTIYMDSSNITFVIPSPTPTPNEIY